MTRKSMVLALAVVLVIAVAIPVVAQERTVLAPTLHGVAKRALKTSQKAARKADTALKTSRAAKRQSRRAEETAQGATANAAAAQAAQADLASTRIRSAFAAGEATSSSEEFVALAGGPSVQVTVPSSGLIEVWAQATIDGDGAVSLFEDGKPLAGQSELCSPDEEVGVLFAMPNAGEPIAVSTPTGSGGGMCGTLGAPGPVLFQTAPGTHTYELRYASCGCGDPVEPVAFSDRRLFVGPRL
jgi:hypothetical protein